MREREVVRYLIPKVRRSNCATNSVTELELTFPPAVKLPMRQVWTNSTKDKCTLSPTAVFQSFAALEEAVRLINCAIEPLEIISVGKPAGSG
ncbi:hypothetical protein ACVJGD_003286 [Bradyrhizobium sp. USDA 10063]